MSRRPQIAIVGDRGVNEEDERSELAFAVGRALVDRGARVVTGGLGGVMASAHAGARASSRYLEGDTIAILPGYDPNDANPWADVVIPTGLGLARNLVVANSDGVIGIGGGAGTLSELALAWQLRRPIVVVGELGWSGKLAGAALDGRDRRALVPEDRVHPAGSAEQAAAMILDLVPRHARIRSV